MRTNLMLLLFAMMGCAHSLPGSSEIEVWAAYRAVRGGARSTGRADNLLFCSTNEGLVVSHAESTGPDDWADKVLGTHVRDDVRVKLASDLALRGDDVRARSVDGEVVLSGRVASDDHALRAIDDVLSIAGVVSVNADLRSPESPAAPRTSESEYCD